MLTRRLAEAGYEVRASDLTRPVWDRVDPGEPQNYWQADLTDAGSAYALARDCDVVVHTAAIPQPIHNPPHVVFGNNVVSTFNILEAAIVAGALRFVNFSSGTVPGFIFAHRAFKPELYSRWTKSSGAATGPVRDGEVVDFAASFPQNHFRRRVRVLRPAPDALRPPGDGRI